MKIKEVIIVEGKNDTNVLKSYLDCETIETHGTCLSQFTLNYIKKMQKEKGVIIFTDPDTPGEKIRSIINEKVPGCKNAFLPREKALGKHKIGIEHANKDDIIEALSHLLTYDKDYDEKISKEDLFNLGLSGKENSNELRNYVGKRLNIGKTNSKTLYKRLNMLGVKLEQLERIIKEYYEQSNSNT